jgi:hypothetical protein
MADTARRISVASALYDELYIAERDDTPGVWTVEAYLKDGAIEQAIFIGPEVRERAEAYMKSQYGRQRRSLARRPTPGRAVLARARPP